MNNKEYNLSLIIIIAFTFLLYGNTLWNSYSGDDCIFITDNSVTSQGFKRIKEILMDDGVLKGWLETNKAEVEGNGFRKRYRPLSQLTFAAEVQFFGTNPHISHFINVLLFAVTSLLIFIIFFKISNNFIGNKWYLQFPFLVAILFVAHPIHTEVVANIKSRDEIMALFFSLLSLYLTIKYFENFKWKFLLFSFLSFFLALLSKENAIIFLLASPLTIYFFRIIRIKEFVSIQVSFSCTKIMNIKELILSRKVSQRITLRTLR